MWHMLSSNSKSCTPAHGAQCLWFSVENLIVLNRHTHTQRDRGWAVLTPPLCFAFITLPCHLTLLPYHLISTGLLSPPPPLNGLKNDLPSHRVISQAAADVLLYAVCKVTKSHKPLLSGLYLHCQNPVLLRCCTTTHCHFICRKTAWCCNQLKTPGESREDLCFCWGQWAGGRAMPSKDVKGERSSPTGEKREERLWLKACQNLIPHGTLLLWGIPVCWACSTSWKQFGSYQLEVKK